MGCGTRAGGGWNWNVNVGVSNEELAANEPDFLTLVFGIIGASAPQTLAARTLTMHSKIIQQLIFSD